MSLDLRRLKERVTRIVLSLRELHDIAQCRPKARAVSSDRVSPSNQASPSASYWLMLPHAGFGCPRFATPRCNACAAVSVGTFTLRHQNATATDIRIAGLRRQPRSDALNLQRRLLALVCASGLIVLTETRTLAETPATRPATGAPGLPNESTAV
jgi:hypothetical protein